MLRASLKAVREKHSAPPQLESSSAPRPSLAVLIAARDERLALPQTLAALLAQEDQPERILIVDDGSTDGTATMLARDFGIEWRGENPLGQSRQFPQLQALKKANSGKADSLNQALALTSEEIVCTLDADTQVEPGAIAAFREAFARDPTLWAACGVLTPVCRGPGVARAFQLYQGFEYLRGFLWRLAWMRDETLILISGAFAGFRRGPLLEAGAFDPSSRVEDYELIFRLYRLSFDSRRPSNVRVIAEARAVTDSPAQVGLFLRQRTRWFAGFIETMFRNHDMVGSRAYGRLGSFHLLIKTLDMLLPLYGLASLLALVAILALGKPLDPLVAFALVFKLLFDLTCHASAVGLYQRWLGYPITPRTIGRSLFATLTEPFAFQLLRQVGAGLGWIAFLRGRIEWAPQRAVIPEHAPE
jgi:cellulose synthase/poly-beta-1,6-N-acetylglucosamine synthase-like glycosyltransferase